MDTNHVLKINLQRGPFRSRLLRALEALGGAYGVLREPAAASKRASASGGRHGTHTAEIVFGAPEAYVGQHVVEWRINEHLDRFLAASANNKIARLEAAGIPASLDGQGGRGRRGFQRRYAVAVFHLQALEAIPIQPGGAALPYHRGEPGLDPESPLWRRLARAAVKALYAFGLDLGEVVIRAGEEGKFTVEEIHPVPVYGETHTAGKVAAAMTRMLAGLEASDGRPDEILLGMDPEFLLYDGGTGKVVPASRYLARRGIAGCDVLRYRGQRLYPLAELRPEPGREPRDLVRHLLRAFRAAQEAIPAGALLWQAGAMPQRGFPLGGHLHLSGVPLTGELLRTLDNYLALPVALLEAKGSGRRRPAYGFLGDFRLQPHGGFEYRTLPSFLISPLVTKGAVALARLIAEEYRGLTKRPLQEDRLFHAFYSGNKGPLRRVWPQLAEDIKALPGYSRYSEYIEPLLLAVESGRAWDESRDIRRVWRLQLDS
ncbi:hypothetical protein V3851_15780 [Paenibacillus sp. M1]|uniref:Phage phiEco32-like COOH.NH2 ligase-type 2 n=1 Tax=Paenibacillus haidiansis TaxID=1574488 RepID=A0ABU7VU78_9BACL